MRISDTPKDPRTVGVAVKKKKGNAMPKSAEAYARIFFLTKIPKSVKRAQETARPITGMINRIKSRYSPSVRSGMVLNHIQKVITGIPAASTVSASSFGFDYFIHSRIPY